MTTRTHRMLALVLALIASGALAAEPANLITNGGFEQGARGWQTDPKHEITKDPRAAHSGGACLTGEVTQASQALRLKRQVPVKAGNLYTFSCWARATNRTKLVLWAVLPDSPARKMIASWKSVPRKWTRYAVPINIAADGLIKMEIIAPSSYGEPAGRMWVDDISLMETKMPPVWNVSQGKGFNDEPAMAAMGDGSVLVAWNSFRMDGEVKEGQIPDVRNGGDSLQLARFTLDGGRFKPAGRWQGPGGKGTYLLNVALAPKADGKGAVVLYAQEVKGTWDIHALTVNSDGPGKAVPITRHAGVDVKPTATVADKRLWVAWESNRGGFRQVFAASVDGGKVSEPVALSEKDISSYAPSIAATADGRVHVAWHAFADHNYDIFLRTRSADGKWGKVRRLTQSPGIDRHPTLTARGGELWLVYENAQVVTYHVGSTRKRQLLVARVTPTGLKAARAAAKGPLAGRTEAGSLAFDNSGRAWLAYLTPRLPRAGWDVQLTCNAGQKWQRPSGLSGRKGMDRRPQLAVVAGRAIVCFQADDIPNSWSTVDKTPSAKSDIYLASLPVADAPVGGVPSLVPMVEPAEPFEAAELHVLRGEDAPTPSITYKGQTLKLYYGDLHEHSNVSVCNRVGDQTIDESYQHMRDLVRLDFACMTDHGYNLSPYFWNLTAKLARANDDPGRYLTFLAEEWTSSFEKYSVKHPYGYYGHHNVILADSYFPRWWNSRNGQTPADVWNELRAMKANFVVIPHQLADTGNVPTDWTYTDETTQPVAEIFQTRGSYEYKGAPREAGRSTPKPGYFLQDAWARGIVIGVIAAPDHGGGYGKACVYAPELTRAAVLDALRKRRCFGTSAARIFLDVRVNGHLLGEKVPAPAGKAVEVKIAARCPGDIERIDICRNNQFIYTNTPKGKTADLTFTDRDPLPGQSYYYVRVIQKDKELAWTSPVWLGAK